MVGVFLLLLLLSHFNEVLHFKAIVHPKPIFNSTLCRFRLRWDFSNPWNHSGVSQTEATRLARCLHNGSLVLEGKQKQRKRDVSPHRSPFRPHVFTSICHNTVFVLAILCFFYIHCSVRAKIHVLHSFPQPPERTRMWWWCREACRTVDVLAPNMEVMLCYRVKLYCWVFQALGTTAQQQEPDSFPLLFSCFNVHWHGEHKLPLSALKSLLLSTFLLLMDNNYLNNS